MRETVGDDLGNDSDDWNRNLHGRNRSRGSVTSLCLFDLELIIAAVRSMKKKKAKPEIEKAFCNACRSRTAHQVVGRHDGDRAEEAEGYWWATFYVVLQCLGCQEIVLRRTEQTEDEPEGEVSYFPPVMSRYLPKWRFQLPGDLRLILEEIYKSLDSASLCLPMMGARTLVDMLMVDKVEDVGGFGRKLQELEKAGYISSKNREVLFTALDMGNAAVHRGHMPTRAAVQSVMDIVENMLQAVYVFSDVAKRLKASTPPRPPRPARAS